MALAALRSILVDLLFIVAPIVCGGSMFCYSILYGGLVLVVDMVAVVVSLYYFKGSTSNFKRLKHFVSSILINFLSFHL